eukprot:TRINITY_DN7112_c0_g1_i1.p1 TRINITY_DN7112_c0_g1~~TRINITY_DN7112_c0_g1_i1.p1  ORF type:complete len:582 (-),score=143.50 TRINITY_DN7112_c0_g1_i1:412-2157(-)
MAVVEWADSRWQEEINTVRHWMQHDASALGEEAVSIINANIKRGDTNAAMRARCIAHLRLELADVAGSPYYEGENMENIQVITTTPHKAPFRAPDSSPVKASMRVPDNTPVKTPRSPQPIYERSVAWLKDHQDKIEEARKQREAKLEQDLTFRPELVANMVGITSKIAPMLRGEHLTLPPRKPTVERVKPAREHREPLVETRKHRSRSDPAPMMVPMPTVTHNRQYTHTGTHSATTSLQVALPVVPKQPKVAKKKKNALKKQKAAEALAMAEQLEQEMEQMSLETKFDREHLNVLVDKFKSTTDDCSLNAGVDETAFLALMSDYVDQPFLAQRLYSAFSDEASGSLNFRKFVANLSTLTNGSLDDILQFCFKVYDTDSDGQISREELHKVLCSALQDKNEDDLLFVVMMIFKEYDQNHDGRISYAEFERLCHTDPLLLVYIQNHFAQDVGLPSAEESSILKGAARIQEEKLAYEQAERDRAARRATIDFRFDPTSNADTGRWRLQDPEQYEIGSDYRKASGQRGVALVCARHIKTGDIQVVEIRFDKSRFPEDDAAFWWDRNMHRFDKTWQQADWDALKAQ